MGDRRRVMEKEEEIREEHKADRVLGFFSSRPRDPSPVDECVLPPPPPDEGTNIVVTGVVVH